MQAYDQMFFTPKTFMYFLHAYTTYVRPLVESSTVVWAPWLKSDKLAIEKVQHCFTRAICRRAGIAYNNYSHRLLILGLKSLEHRRIFFDLCMCFNIYYELVDLDFKNFFSVRPVSRYPSRVHPLQLYISVESLKTPAYRRNFFTNRVVNIWNSLPEAVVTASNIDSFKFRLNSVDLYPFCTL